MEALNLSDHDFNRISKYIHEYYGIRLDGKRDLISSRLSKRVRELDLPSFGKYFDYAIEANHDDELHRMVDSLSTNLTFFFRESKHFDFLQDTVFPELLKSKNREVKIWSAGCSTGEEPYSLAMHFSEFSRKNSGMPIPRILATDLSTKVLAAAKAGVYSLEKLKNVSAEMMRLYFLKGHGNSKGRVKVKPELQSMITFKYLNLMESFPVRGPFDFIFCRNVIIYFDRPTQENLVNKFTQVLKPGGYLFLGHSEGLSGVKHSLKYVAPAVYRTS